MNTETNPEQNQKLKHNWFKLVLSLAIVLAVGYSAGIFTSQKIETWYTLIKKPVFNPPNWIFGPVWSVLFFLIGCSLYLVWNTKTQIRKTKAISIFFLQLIFNFLWSFLFFYFESPSLAFIEIVILIILIILNQYYFYPINRLSAKLLYPYLFWVVFAAILNGSIVYLNMQN